MTDTSKYHVLYDGECGFCNFWVQWILKNDNKDQFLFASLQSDFGQNFLAKRGLCPKIFTTLYLWKPETFYLTKSDAVFKIADIIGGKYKILSYLTVLPKILRNPFYDFVSKYRQNLSSQKCYLPTPNERKKFLG
ncbi:thiol-disulfide oxidoreductase DCC family protein [Frigoriflavimonas asaccharolytica]|uniref:Putative DCC family thiol-disulfide oxidoreductase YuxK n=1 Tax=Frigoriflavimonas asaccharolytica TaxID=2735899 RepID=A0A8J8G5P2_9FLAO|nr:DCC1-like thiol-disulfide oxidoreductase family protein [Frigoriflavimonas asaccharolytica]NRS91948.1 putative DCC family thiol-disulfide oxidoreductase YuxK [Frigoriflavimonas asaccharolytica]